MRRISAVIEDLQEIQKRFGDLEIVVGEASSITRSKFECNVDTKGKHDGESWDEKVCIIQAYVRLT